MHQQEYQEGNAEKNRHGADDPASDRCHLRLESKTAGIGISTVLKDKLSGRSLSLRLIRLGRRWAYGSTSSPDPAGA
jgi:hypothetical protein